MVEEALGDLVEDSLLPSERPISDFGRVVEKISYDQLRRLDPRTASLLEHRGAYDEILAEVTPQFTTMYESSPEYDRIESEQVALVSNNAAAFTVANDPDILIKYVHDCLLDDNGRKYG